MFNDSNSCLPTTDHVQHGRINLFKKKRILKIINFELFFFFWSLWILSTGLGMLAKELKHSTAELYRQLQFFKFPVINFTKLVLVFHKGEN